MNISIPENVGGELRVLPEDTYDASIMDMFLGESKAGAPKITVKWVITSEFSGEHDEDYLTTVGENVLEIFSLQPQALFNLNSLYKSVTGEKLPMGDYTPDDFLNAMKQALVGASGAITLQVDSSQGNPRMKVIKRVMA